MDKGLDMSVFRPADRALAKAEPSLPSDVGVILVATKRIGEKPDNSQPAERVTG